MNAALDEIDAAAAHVVAGAVEAVLVLLLAATGLAILARRLGLPYPILLVLGGLALGFLPGLPRVELEPDLVFLLFLPPILFGAGYFTSIRDFKANLRSILLLAVGLVLFTATIVAIVAEALIPGLGFPAAFAFGAIVAPPDAVAATSIFQRLGVPRRAVTILEGESLVNDATALVAYRLAVGAVATGSFSLLDAGGALVTVSIVGVAVGLVVGWIVSRVIGIVDDPVFSVVITFLAPAAAYIPAETFGGSGVLAAVAGGIYVGRHAPRRMSSEVRLAGVAAWQVLLFLINGAVFILIGIQLPAVLEALAGRPVGDLVLLSVAMSTVVILVRIAWVFPGTYLPRLASPSLRAREPAPQPRNVFLVSWAGMRGVVSLAAALALPHTLPDGRPFPERDLLIFLTFSVILATLVGQGLTLPLVIRALGIRADGGEERQEATARVYLAEAALEAIDGLGRDHPDHLPLVETLRAQYQHRAEHLGAHQDSGEPADEVERELLEHRAMRHAVIEAEREALFRLHDRAAVSDEVFRRVERDLDLEELRMEA